MNKVIEQLRQIDRQGRADSQAKLRAGRDEFEPVRVNRTARAGFAFVLLAITASGQVTTGTSPRGPVPTENTTSATFTGSSDSRMVALEARVEKRERVAAETLNTLAALSEEVVLVEQLIRSLLARIEALEAKLAEARAPQ